jgi:hypothetical protein
VSVRDVGFGFPLFFALLIEIVSAFGPATIVAYAEATRGRPTGHGTLEPATAGFDMARQAAAGSGELVQADVISWVAGRCVPVGGKRAIRLEELHSDYLQWCAARRRDAAKIATFEQAFDRACELPELAGKIRKVGKRYLGVGLAEPARCTAAFACSARTFARASGGVHRHIASTLRRDGEGRPHAEAHPD